MRMVCRSLRTADACDDRKCVCCSQARFVAILQIQRRQGQNLSRLKTGQNGLNKRKCDFLVSRLFKADETAC